MLPMPTFLEIHPFSSNFCCVLKLENEGQGCLNLQPARCTVVLQTDILQLLQSRTAGIISIWTCYPGTEIAAFESFNFLDYKSFKVLVIRMRGFKFRGHTANQRRNIF